MECSESDPTALTLALQGCRRALFTAGGPAGRRERQTQSERAGNPGTRCPPGGCHMGCRAPWHVPPQPAVEPEVEKYSHWFYSHMRGPTFALPHLPAEFAVMFQHPLISCVTGVGLPVSPLTHPAPTLLKSTPEFSKKLNKILSTENTTTRLLLLYSFTFLVLGPGLLSLNFQILPRQESIQQVIFVVSTEQ